MDPQDLWTSQSSRTGEFQVWRETLSQKYKVEKDQGSEALLTSGLITRMYTCT